MLIPTKCSGTMLSLDDDLERPHARRPSEGVVSIQDAIELEAVGNQALGIDFPDCTVLSSMGVVTVSTSRVVMVMFRDHRRSR